MGLVLLCTLLPIIHLINANSLLKHKNIYKRIKPKKEKGMSILIPCYNEEGILIETLRGMNKVEYNDKEIIFINDGSTDETLEILKKALFLKSYDQEMKGDLSYKPVKGIYRSTIYKNIYVIDKLNGGKADSLNVGIDFASKELVITLDADTILKEDSLDIINRAFDDKNVIAGGGMVSILQGGQHKSRNLSFKSKMIVRFQIFEYLKGFYIYKASLAKFNALSIISGAFGVFDREILIKLGGYRHTIGEDIDITMKFQEYKLQNPTSKIIFIPQAVAYTECPENWMDLFKQRVRWQKAFIDCAIKYSPLLIKTIFKRSVSFFFLVDALLVGTLATSFTILYLLFLPLFSDDFVNILIIYLIFSYSINFLYSVMAFKISNGYGVKIKGKDLLRFFNTVILDLAIFRFINMFFVISGTILYFFNKNDWNKVKRTGRVYYEEKAS
jgi:cellulose synthase/poly-beta-1,6-N-acetylglucosamine synthase-like glycosyltransferase